MKCKQSKIFFLQPRSGVFCALITEARQTIPLEMPDKENTFVLKAGDNQEYVIEAKDAAEMKSWLATIRYCMRSTPTSQVPPTIAETSTASLPNTSLLSEASSTNASGITNAQPSSSTTANASETPVNNNNTTTTNNNVNSTNHNNQLELPPRRPETSTASGHFHLEEDDLLHDSDLTAMMSEYPWYIKMSSLRVA